MHYINHYHSPLGTILLAADDTGLTGLWFEGQRRKRVLRISNSPPLAGCLFLRAGS